MKGITIGPAGGHGLSRMQGTKVTLAGRTAFLPNDDVRHEVLAPVSLYLCRGINTNVEHQIRKRYVVIC